jgi:F-type H+-transporting ATPase subunit epsilon
MAERHSNTFRLVIASVGETLFDGAASSVTLPGTQGVMTVLANHEPIVTTLKKGTIVVKSGSDHKEFPVETGVLECSQGRAVVLL